MSQFYIIVDPPIREFINSIQWSISQPGRPPFFRRVNPATNSTMTIYLNRLVAYLYATYIDQGRDLPSLADFEKTLATEHFPLIQKLGRCYGGNTNVPDTYPLPRGVDRRLTFDCRREVVTRTRPRTSGVVLNDQDPERWDGLS